MNLADRFRNAWAALNGRPARRSDPYAGTYGIGGSSGGFAGASIGRLTASLANWSGSINADNDVALPILRARARALTQNNEHGKRFLSMVATNVVGRRNPRLQVRAMRDQRDPNKPTTLDKSANDAIEIHWERWGKTADISGRHRSLYSFMRTVSKSCARDGEALVRLVRNRALPYGMALQHLEADRLDDARNVLLSNGNSIRQGVEIDSTGRAVAYWVKTAHPGENYATAVANIERVPAGEMIHLFMADRAEQVRGVTWLHAIIIRGSIIHKFEESAVTAAHIGASKVAALERSEDAPDSVMSMADGTSNGAPTGIPQMSVEAGEMFELPPGYKLSSWNPDYPHQNFESFLKACLRGLAAGLDVAAHNLTGDMTDVNYSSARIAELSERETWMALQDWFIESFVMVVYEQWLAMALLSGAITFEITGKSLPADKFAKFFNASRFQGRRWAWVDPAKEADANKTQLENKLTSRTRLAAEQGDEFEDILDELAQEKTAIDDAGLAPVVQQKQLLL
jgi:lambda family phage portal protein